MRYDEPIDHSFRRVIAQRIKVRSRHVVSLRLLETAKVSSWIEPIADALIVELEAYIAGIGEERIIVQRHWPKTWWDAFKQRWFPQWAINRWPVQFEFIDINRPVYAAVCPHLHVVDNGKHLEWMLAQTEKFSAQTTQHDSGN